MNLSKNVKFTLVKAAQTAGTSAVNSDPIDMSGWDGVVFFGSIATQAANNIANLAQSSDDAASDDYTDLAGSGLVTAANGNSFVLDLYKPGKRYVRTEIARGTSTATGDIYAIQYRGSKKPIVTHGTSVVSNVKLLVSPSEGAA